MNFNVKVPTLSTDRIILRAFREDDAPALAKVHNNAEVMRFISPTGEAEPSLRKAWEYMVLTMGHWLFKGYGKWALIDAKTDELIGRVGYFDGPYEWPGLELGWTIGRDAWGKGFASEAAALALDWGFKTLNTNEIISAIHPDNERSARVADRIGEKFVRMGTIHGGPCRIFAITRDQWHARKAGEIHPRT